MKAYTFPLSNGLVVINPALDRVHILNPQAAIVHGAMAHGLTCDQVIEQTLARCAAEECRGLKAILTSLFADWEAEGLLAGGYLAAYPRSQDMPLKPDRIRICRSREEKSSCRFQNNVLIHDFPVQIHCDQERIQKRILDLYGHIRLDIPGKEAESVFHLTAEGADHCALQQDGRLLSRSEDLDSLVIALSNQVAELWQRNRDWLTIAHAAAVGRDHFSIVLPARGGSGKTTLTAALLAEGVTFLSDDIVPIDRGTGEAVPHPLCLHLKQGSVAVLASRYPELVNLHDYPWGSTRLRYMKPCGFDLAASTRSWPVSALVFPCFSPDAAICFQKISPLESFQELILADCMLGVPVDLERVRLLCQWVEERPSYTLRYSSLNEAVAVIMQLFQDLL